MVANLIPQNLASGTYSLQPFSSADFKGILSTHLDGGVRIWDCDRGRELIAFTAAAPSSGYLRAVSASKRSVAASDASVASTEQITNHVQTVITGDGDGWVKTWAIPAHALVNTATDKTTTAETPFPGSKISARTLVKPGGSERYQFEAVHQLAVADGATALVVAAAVTKTELPRAEGEDLPQYQAPMSSRTEFRLWKGLE